MASRLRWPGLLFAFVVLLNCIAGAALLAWPKAHMAPLVGGQDWTFSGRIYATPTDSAKALPTRMQHSPALRLWRSYSPETGATHGSIATTAFDWRPYIAIPFFGFPGEVAGNTIRLRCVADGKTLTVADMRTNTEWSIAYLHVPKTFCPGRLRLEAAATSDGFIVGIGTPYSISPATYFAAKTFPVKALVLTLGWAWFAVLIGAGGVWWQLAFGQEAALAAGFAGTGLLGLGAFFTYQFSPYFGTVATSLTMLLVPIAAAFTFRLNPAVVRHFISAHGPKLLIWFIIAWIYAALVNAIDNGGGTWSVNAAFSPARWSSDNQIPFQFAEGMYNGTPHEQITWGPWLASDRPPLLSGLLLLVRPLIGAVASPVNSELIGTLDMTIAIVLVASWVLPVYRFGESIYLNNGFYPVAAAAMSPLFLFNTVYVWPKLLGASYALFVFLELAKLSSGRRDRKAMVLSGISAALSILSHASNAMIFPVFGLLFARPVLRQGPITICLAMAATIVVLLPWQLWQSYVQPHGNALLRYALSGDFGMTNRSKPILPDVIATYRSLGLAGWIALKLDGIMIMLGSMRASVPLHEAASYGPGLDGIGNLRIADFFSVFRSIGVPVTGLLLLPIVWSSKMRLLDRLTIQAAICGVTAIVLSLLVFIPAPITHQLPYAAVALTLLAGASVLGAWPRLTVAALSVEAVYCLVVWMADPLVAALRIEGFALFGFAAGVLPFADLVWLNLRRPPYQASSLPL